MAFRAAILFAVGNSVAAKLAKTVILTAAVFLSTVSYAWPEPHDAVVPRLLGVCRLWSVVRFFDPTIVENHIDWDQALIDSLPAIVAAKSDVDFRTAVDAMLSRLNDTGTYIEGDAPDAPASELPMVAVVDGLARVTISGYPTTSNHAAYARALASAFGTATRAEAIVIDLRAEQQPSADQADQFAELFDADLIPHVAKTTLYNPAFRSRVYIGFPSTARPPIRNGYRAGFETFPAEGTPYTRAADARDVPVAFVVNANSRLSPGAQALIAADRAAAFASTALPDITLAASDEIELIPGVHVEVRTEEAMSDDGGAGIQIRSGGFADALAYVRQPSASAERHTAVTRPPVEHYYGADSGLPDEAHRILAAFRIWSTIRFFFPYRNLMHDNWDAALERALVRLRNASTPLGYELILARLYSHIHDSHGSVTGPALRRAYDGQVPFAVHTIQGKLAIVGVESAAMAHRDGYTIGDTIVSIDSKTPHEREKDLTPYVAASTPQALDWQLDGRGLVNILAGRAGSTATITLQRADGTRRVIHVIREAFFGALPLHAHRTVTILPGNVAYVDLTRLSAADVGAMFRKVANTRAIIFDLRGYPKPIAWAVAARLTKIQGLGVARWSTPFVRAPVNQGEHSPFTRDFIQKLPIESGSRYLRPTVTLIDEDTMSLAEHTGLFLEAVGHSRFVGSPTVGADGDVTNFDVPGGVVLSFSGAAVRHVDGRQLQRIGLIPDVPVRPTTTGIRQGDDEVLLKALQVLRVSAADRIAERARERRLFQLGLRPRLPERIAPGPSQALSDAWHLTAGSSAYYRLDHDRAAIHISSKASALTARAFAEQTLDATPYLGKRVRLFGKVRAADVTAAWAGMWMMINGAADHRALAAGEMRNRGLAGTTGWIPFSIVLNVPHNAKSILCGMELSGPGNFWAKDLRLQIVPSSVAVTSQD